MEGSKSRINCGILDINNVSTHSPSTFEDDLRAKINTCSSNRGADFGLVLASLGFHQFVDFEPMLLNAGFRFVRDFHNPNMGHDGRLYALVLEDAHNPRNKEKVKSAGVKKKYNG